MESPNVHADVVTAMSVCGGMTESIFPHAESLLISPRGKFKEAIIALFRDPEYEYLSVVDLLFCELNPSWRSACFAYYRDKQGSRQLRKMLEEGEIREREIRIHSERLTIAIALAVDMYERLLEQKRPRGKKKGTPDPAYSWVWLRSEMDRRLPAPARHS